MESKSILGISAYYHDSAAVFLRGGEVVAAAQEERFSRRKHDPGFPGAAIRYCLREGGITLAGVDAVVFYDKPLLKFERLLETYLGFAPRGLRSFLELGPGRSVSNMVRKICPEAETRAVSTWEEVKAFGR